MHLDLVRNVPVYEEELVAGKRQEQVSDTVRKERVVVDGADNTGRLQNQQRR